MKQLESTSLEKLSNVFSTIDKNYNPRSINLDLKEFIMRLNNRYPWDLWWRNKHSVAYGSSQYKEMNHIDMLMEYIEYKHIEYLKKKRIDDEEEAENESMGITKGKNQIKMSKKEVDEIFDNLDLSQFNNLDKK